MRINRAVGFIIFLLVGRILLRDVFSATSEAIIAVMHTVGIASETMAHKMQEEK